MNKIMFAGLRRLLLTGGFLLLASCAAWAQTTTLQGDVKDENGQPLKGALIVLTRTDIKGHYQVKSDKKGHWLYTGLPLGKYDIECQVDGKTVDKVNGVQSSYSDDGKPIDFNLKAVHDQQAAAQAANSQGELTEQQSKSMTKEQKEALDAQLKKNAEINKHNKALNDAYNSAQDSIKAGNADTDNAKKITDYQAAIDNLNKAVAIDPNQIAIWNTMGDAYRSMGRAQTGDDRNKSYDAAIDAYKKSLAIKEEAGVYNEIGNLYGAEKKFPEATEALTKSAQLDPSLAPKAYFNMGANLVNGGQPAKAAEFFKKAADADPKYAEAWYQYGSLQMMQGTVDAKTGAQIYPPDTATALKNYLDLAPTGPHAAEATAMLQAMGETVQTKVSVPQTKKKKN
jgi:tetratricopeptide (TPR) repeat protein